MQVFPPAPLTTIIAQTAIRRDIALINPYLVCIDAGSLERLEGRLYKIHSTRPHSNAIRDALRETRGAIEDLRTLPLIDPDAFPNLYMVPSDPYNRHPSPIYPPPAQPVQAASLQLRTASGSARITLPSNYQEYPVAAVPSPVYPPLTMPVQAAPVRARTTAGGVRNILPSGYPYGPPSARPVNYSALRDRTKMY